MKKLDELWENLHKAYELMDKAMTDIQESSLVPENIQELAKKADMYDVIELRDELEELIVKTKMKKEES